MKPVDGHEAIEKLLNLRCIYSNDPHFGTLVELNKVVEVISGLKQLDMDFIRHSHWNLRAYKEETNLPVWYVGGTWAVYAVCPECHNLVKDEIDKYYISCGDDIAEQWAYHEAMGKIQKSPELLPFYCSNCGVRMDGKVTYGEEKEPPKWLKNNTGL